MLPVDPAYQHPTAFVARAVPVVPLKPWAQYHFINPDIHPFRLSVAVLAFHPLLLSAAVHFGGSGHRGKNSSRPINDRRYAAANSSASLYALACGCSLGSTPSIVTPRANMSRSTCRVFIVTSSPCPPPTGPALNKRSAWLHTSASMGSRAGTHQSVDHAPD